MARHTVDYEERDAACCNTSGVADWDDDEAYVGVEYGHVLEGSVLVDLNRTSSSSQGGKFLVALASFTSTDAHGRELQAGSNGGPIRPPVAEL
ncbi:hypothetical protein ACHAXA_004687 [Cyclostephanos tholiformis]